MKSQRVLVLVGLSFIFLFSSLIFADVPQMINYQGKITDPQGALIDTIVAMTFSIYSSSIAGVPLWTETQASVVIEKGIFSVLLGSVNPIPDSVFDGTVQYLGVKVGGDSEMIPRKAIVSVGNAFRSAKADTAEYALSATPDDDWDIDTSGFNIYRLTGNVGIGSSIPPQYKLDVGGTAQMTGFKMLTGASNGYVLTSDGSGMGTWQSAAGGDNDWTFRITDTADTTLMTGGAWGIARYGNTLYGNADSTHVNLGVACTTGTSGQNYKYCTVGGGYSNTASGVYATVGGGERNTASGQDATVGGGYSDTASYYYATVGGGRYNTASGISSTVGGGENNTASGASATVGGGTYNTASGKRATVGGGCYNTVSGWEATVGGGCYNTASDIRATVGGGWRNTASGYIATVPGGYADTAAGDYSLAAGSEVVVSSDADYTFAFGRDFTTSTPNAVIFHNTHNPIKVGIGTASPQGALDVNSTTGALIVPRMTTAQRNALTAVNGMIIYNTTTNQFNFYENGAWVTK